MSWNRKEFRQAYNRAQDKTDTRNIQWAEEKEIWADLQRDYINDEMIPSMREISTGRLLTLLVDLRVRYAGELLKSWYW